MKGADEEEVDDGEGPCLFGNGISVQIFKPFLRYRPLSGESNVGEVGILQLAGIDALEATVLTCLYQKEKQGGYIQKFTQTCLQVV